MALPKYKMSRSRTRKRKSTWTLTAPTLTECPSCHEKKPAHRACPECGFYKGLKVQVKGSAEKSEK